jgi:hypothetical protein
MHEMARLPRPDARGERAAAHAQAWRAIAAPGAVFGGAARRDMVIEARAARACRLCAMRAQALSPALVGGGHDVATSLPAAVVELVHRMVTDPGRIGAALHRRLCRDGGGMLTDAAYVEVVGVVAAGVLLDTMALGLGGALPEVPAALPGAPSGEINADAVDGGAFVPILARESEQMANIVRALGLVPPVRRLYWTLMWQHYRVRPGVDSALGRGQQELIAARISALNRCEY